MLIGREIMPLITADVKLTVHILLTLKMKCCSETAIYGRQQITIHNPYGFMNQLLAVLCQYKGKPSSTNEKDTISWLKFDHP